MTRAELPAVLRLTLGRLELDLMTEDGPYRVAAVELSFPSVREDSTDRPEAHGTIDTTQFFGARAVTISGSIVDYPKGSRRRALDELGPFLDPGARPTLTFALDEGDEPRAIDLRADSLTAPFVHPTVTQFALSYKAPDGFAYSPTPQVVYCTPLGLINGRHYPLEFPRTYPPVIAPVYGWALALGQLPAVPKFTIWGPAAAITIFTLDSYTGEQGQIALKDDFVVEAGEVLVIDCHERTIELDGRNVYGLALGGFADWPTFTPGNETRLSLVASDVSDVSSMMATEWVDRWLT